MAYNTHVKNKRTCYLNTNFGTWKLEKESVLMSIEIDVQPMRKEAGTIVTFQFNLFKKKLIFEVRIICFKIDYAYHVDKSQA